MSSIADTAYLLSCPRQEAGQHRERVNVATLGPLVEPCSGDLQPIAINATSAHSGPDEAEQVRGRHAQVMTRPDPELA